MPSGHHGAVLRQIQRVFGRGSVAGVSEDQLLERALARHDAAAFEALILRHGPMVWGVCQGVLRNSADADDAFQATFLVLLRKARSLRDPGRLSPWLYGVASRVATRARVNAARRRDEERKAVNNETVHPAPNDDDLTELRAALDEEIGQLPDRYRGPVVLCHVEGLTYEQAAHSLGCSPTTVRGRLARARERLRRRLTRRGLAPGAILAGAWLGAESASAAVPETLMAMTAQVVACAAAGQALASLVTHRTNVLIEQELGSMLIFKVKSNAVVLLATAIAGVAAAGLVTAANRKDQPREAAEPSGHAPLALAQADPAPRPPIEPGAGPPSPDGRCVITVVAKDTGKALAGATVEPSIDMKHLRLTAGPDGRVFIDRAGTLFPGTLSFDVSADGYVQQRFFFAGDDPNYQKIPESLTVTLLPGEETFGGRVVDEQGQPIAGVAVDLWGYLPSASPGKSLILPGYRFRSRKHGARNGGILGRP
jgi:RNA polymerase sigma factor (sigma-70 family)